MPRTSAAKCHICGCVWTFPAEDAAQGFIDEHISRHKARGDETREARAIRRQVAEEIAQAIEAQLRREPQADALRRSPADYLRSAAELAREIGSKETS
jgi:hypothetical protein